MDKMDKIIPILEDEHINRYIKEQFSFLRKIHPFLDDDNYHEECIEIRPIARIKNKYFKSLNIWRLDNKGKELYLKFLRKVNGQAVCIYYSGYTMDYKKETFTADGKLSEKGKINKENAIYTQILPMDFDNLSLEQFEDEISRLNNLGIETINIFTGHGFQSLILLNTKVYDKDLYRKFTYLLLSRGFSVDPKIIDPSRILRLPYTFNCKEFDERYNTNNPKAIATFILNDTNIRYSPEEVFELISSLKIRDESYNISLEAFKCPSESVNLFNRPISLLEQNKRLISENNELIEYKNINDLYNDIINFDALPNAVQKMLIETPKGYRNSTLMFLIPFFRNKIGLSFEKIIEIMKIWNKNCSPPQDEDFIVSEVKRIYSYNYKGTGAYTKELAEKFGYIEFEEYKLKDKIIIPNVLFHNYDKLHETAVKIFFMMKLFEERNDIKEWDIELIAKVSKVSEKTVRRYIKQLIDIGLIDKKNGNKRNKEKDKYYISIFWDKSFGFTKFNPYTIESMIYTELDVLIDSEIKVYTYIYFMLNGTDNSKCYASQSYIGKKVGLTRQRVSEITDSLVAKRRLQKKKYIGEDNLPHCIYYLRG